MQKINPEEVPEYQEELSPAEEQEILEALTDSGYPRKPEAGGLLGFFNKILKLDDTTKVSNLDERELEAVRILQSAAEYAEEMDLKKVAEYLRKKAEIILSSADSKEGFLIEMAATQKKHLYTESKTGGKKKGWNLKKG